VLHKEPLLNPANDIPPSNSGTRQPLPAARNVIRTLKQRTGTADDPVLLSNEGKWN
jgi:hypothetical protein